MGLLSPPDVATAVATNASACTLRDRVRLVTDIAASQAATVDRDATFPDAAINEAKCNGLMALMIPRSLGGEGASVPVVANICYELGKACASSAMIFAMHQSALACVLRHAGDSAWFGDALQRIAVGNLLLASSTTEGAGGGNVRSSDAALVDAGGCLHLERAATVISYGAEADGLISIARRSPDAHASDQVLALMFAENYRLTPTGGWDTFGMRGTCSSGFALRAELRPDQILPVDYGAIHARTMVPASHLFWSAAWTGVAAQATARAQAFVRMVSRRTAGQLPPGAHHVTKAYASLRALRALVDTNLTMFERIKDNVSALTSLEMQASFNLLKVDASEQALSIILSATRACGLAGYRNDGDYSMGRHLRDIMSAPIMIHNDRILSNVTTVALMSGIPTSLTF